MGGECLRLECRQRYAAPAGVIRAAKRRDEPDQEERQPKGSEVGRQDAAGAAADVHPEPAPHGVPSREAEPRQDDEHGDRVMPEPEPGEPTDEPVVGRDLADLLVGVVKDHVQGGNTSHPVE